MNIGVRPLHDLAQLVPVVHVGEMKGLDRGARDDHAIEVLIADLVERAIKRVQMAFGHVLGAVACRVQQRDVDLQRSVRQLTHDLRFGCLFGGHQV